MAKKVYVSTTGTAYTFPVKIKKGEKDIVSFITFGNDLKFETSTPDVQKCIEATDYFMRKEIKLLSTEETKEESEGRDFEPAAFPEVTDINGAVEVLKGEPYKIAHQSLRSAEAVKKQAELCRVSFPNLTL